MPRPKVITTGVASMALALGIVIAGTTPSASASTLSAPTHAQVNQQVNTAASEIARAEPPTCGPARDGEIWVDPWDGGVYSCQYIPLWGRWGWIRIDILPR